MLALFCNIPPVGAHVLILIFTIICGWFLVAAILGLMIARWMHIQKPCSPQARGSSRHTGASG